MRPVSRPASHRLDRGRVSGRPIRGICASEWAEDEIEREKRLAAEAAAELVEGGMDVGLGTGSTVAYLLAPLAARGLDIRCVATSPATAEEARRLGLDVVSFEGVDALAHLDIAIDGADQVAPSGWVVKGGGGAHTREKAVAAAADRFIVIVSANKLVDAAGPADPARAGAVRARRDAVAAGACAPPRRAAQSRRRRDRRLLRRVRRPRARSPTSSRARRASSSMGCSPDRWSPTWSSGGAAPSSGSLERALDLFRDRLLADLPEQRAAQRVGLELAGVVRSVDVQLGDHVGTARRGLVDLVHDRVAISPCS